MSQVVHGCTFHNTDCIKGARTHLDDDSVDLIITDPPYGIDGDKLHRHYNRNELHVVDGYVEIPSDEYPRFSREWIGEAERILRPGGQIYVISGYSNLVHILNALQETKLQEINHIIWKYNFGVYTKRKFVSSHYHILYYAKPGRRRTFNLQCRYGLKERDASGGSLNYRDREDVWLIDRQYKPGQQKNKNELPDELLIKMIQYSSNEGDLICDLFLGGFSTARVAVGLNRRATGFEVSDEIFSHGIGTLSEIEPGYLCDTLRVPDAGQPKNQGKRWTEREIQHLLERFRQIKDAGHTKKDAVKELCAEFERGRFSIERILREHHRP